jgi:hypothetical protein
MPVNVGAALAAPRPDQPPARAQRPAAFSVLLRYTDDPGHQERIIADLTAGLVAGFVAWAAVYRWGAAWEQLGVIMLVPLPAAVVALLIAVFALAGVTGLVRWMARTAARLSRGQRAAVVLVAVWRRRTRPGRRDSTPLSRTFPGCPGAWRGWRGSRTRTPASTPSG